MPKTHPKRGDLCMGEYYVAGLPCSDELYHHGILKQRWGVRRFQNSDGSLTPAGRERYGVGKEKAKQALKNAGAKAGQSAKSAASYVARREKMKHPSLMSDEELRGYTQRLIAEKNYSDLLRYQQSNSGLGRAKQYVTDILKRGGGTLADAAFRRLANRISKSKSEAALEKLQREKAKQNLRDQIEDHERQRQIDMLTQQNKINDLQDQLTDADGAQAQKKELERLQREQQLTNLRNNLDAANIDMQQQISQLQQQKQLKELQKALNSNGSEGGFAAAMRIIGDPSSSASQIQEAQQVLKNYNMAQLYMQQIANRASGANSQQSQGANSGANSQQTQNANAGANYQQNQNTNPYTAPAPQPSQGDSWNQYTPGAYSQQNQNTNPYSGPAPAPTPAPQPSLYGNRSQYTPRDRSTINNSPQDFSNYRMSSADGTNGGMYGGRLSNYRMNTGERQSSTYNPYADYRIPPEEEMRYGNGPRRRSMRG